MDRYPKIEEMVGKTFVKVEGVVGGEELRFEASDASGFLFFHDQNCCEGVRIEEVHGELSDLENSPILQAEEVENAETPEGYEFEYEPESFTWTFYKFATIKGSATVRWLGTSNGYYSEGVSLGRI